MLTGTSSTSFVTKRTEKPYLREGGKKKVALLKLLHTKIKNNLRKGRKLKREGKKIDVVAVISPIQAVTTFKTQEFTNHWSRQRYIQLRDTNWRRILCISQVIFIANGLIHLHSLPAKKNYLHYNTIK